MLNEGHRDLDMRKRVIEICAADKILSANKKERYVTFCPLPCPHIMREIWTLNVHSFSTRTLATNIFQALSFKGRKTLSRLGNNQKVVRTGGRTRLGCKHCVRFRNLPMLPTRPTKDYLPLIVSQVHRIFGSTLCI